MLRQILFPLLIALVLSSNSKADYDISIVFLGTGAGRVTLANDTTATTLADTTSNLTVTVPNNTIVTAQGTAASIGISASALNTIEFSDLAVTSVFTPQSTFSSYQRVNGTSINFPIFPTAPDQFTSTAPQNVTLNYTFNLADAFTGAVEFQYFFTSAVPAFTSLGAGDFFSSSSATPVPWSAFSTLGVGTGRTGTVRVIDGAGRFDDATFNFDISPFGGNAAVPEPSSFILFSVVAGAGAVGRRFWRKRKTA